MEIPQITRVFSGAPWEKHVGYCRAVRVQNLIFVSGTAPMAEDGSVACPGDPYGQARRCLEIVRKAVGAATVVRTRMFVTDIGHWEAFGKAHAEAFGANPPATT